MAAVGEQPAPALDAAEQEEKEEGSESDAEPTAAELQQMEMRRRIFKIMSDTTMSEAEKAQARQDVMSGKWADKDEEKKKDNGAWRVCVVCVRARLVSCCVCCAVCWLLRALPPTPACIPSL